jgi:type I site-specific restriction endonuclease
MNANSIRNGAVCASQRPNISKLRFSGRADYVLFVGLAPMAVVETKKENTNVAGKIDQAERYSKGFKVDIPLVGAWELMGRTIGYLVPGCA